MSVCYERRVNFHLHIFNLINFGIYNRNMAPQEQDNISVLGEVVILVDPYSTGCCLAKEFFKSGYKVVALWTRGFSEDMKTHVPLSCKGLQYFAELDEQETLQKTAAKVYEATLGYSIASCVAAGEAGVDFADAFSEYLGLLTNGTEIPNRRDKNVQQELIKANGLRSVRQACGNKFEDVQDFLETEEYPVVLKPLDSAGSDGVKVCNTFEDAKAHFHFLMKKQLVNGPMCDAVLCQEFLKGKEYVVDHISRDGVHKTTMTWVYDKRDANGSTFIYFGTIPVDSESEEAKIVVSYVRSVLDALGIKHGPSHAEVIMTVDGPCLVEMNCRAHGGDGVWIPLAKALTGGYTQVDAAVLAYTNKAGFDAIPDRPPSPFKAQGLNVDLVSYSHGIVKRTPGYDVIRRLPSFHSLETGVKVGSKVERTTDLLTTPGSIILFHNDLNILKRDIEFIRFLEEINGLFKYEEEEESGSNDMPDTTSASKPIIIPESSCVKFETKNTKSLENHHFMSMGGPKLIRRMSENDDPFSSMKGPNLIRRLSHDGPNLIRRMSNDCPELRGGPFAKRITTMMKL